jgi:proline iminopeptidase
MTTLVAGTMVTGAARAQTAAGKLVAIRDTRLYVEDSGPREAPALLYLHGGPGAGSFDFSLYQRERLNARLRTVVIDQRGVLRSDPVDHCTVGDLVEDCEALRKTLGVPSWTVVGHSFGGMLALLYANRYPGGVSRVIFENPAIDIRSSVKALFLAAAVVLEQAGKAKDAGDARALAASDAQTAILWGKFAEFGAILGDHRDDLYTHRPELHGFFEKMIAASGLPAEDWARGGHQQSLLNQDPALFEDHMPLLAGLKMPSVLFKGAFDHVTPGAQIAAMALAPGALAPQYFADSSHFIHVEEPDAYAAAILKVMQG